MFFDLLLRTSGIVCVLSGNLILVLKKMRSSKIANTYISLYLITSDSIECVKTKCENFLI